MGVRFSKKISIGSLLKLNISKSGVSATVGKKGASLNIGSKGAYVNLSPSLVGIKGTGLSYRQKIGGGLSSLLNKRDGKDSELKNNSETKLVKKEDVKEETVDTSLIDEYVKKQEENLFLYKYTDNVLTKEEFDNNINDSENKELYQLAIDGDEDTVESLIGAFLDNLDLNYDVRANYELDNHDLYIDLDLPEIEDFDQDYPELAKNVVVTKKKSAVQLREEYAQIVGALGLYLGANFFNLSSYIDQIVMSAFTSKRNNDGDLVDEYLYSVKFVRSVFEKKDLSTVNDPFKFMLNFDNRVNLSTTHTFKAIKPYTVGNDSLINDAKAGLLQLGYDSEDIEGIIHQLSAMRFDSASDYIKEGLRLLKK